MQQRLPLVGGSTLLAVRRADRCAALLLPFLVVPFLALPSGATQTNWKLTTNGNFSTAGNWDNGLPDSSKVADFGLGLGAATYVVTYSGAAIGFPSPQYQANQLIISGTNTVTFGRSFLQPIAPGLTATNTDTSFASPGLIVGQFSGDNATLNDSVFTTVTNAVVGFTQGSAGTLNISGAGLQFANMVAGYRGLGALNIAGGTHVSGSNGIVIGEFGNVGSQGKVTVSGAGTLLSANDILVGGASPDNLLTISGGAQVSVATHGYVGYEAGASGTVLVDGPGSAWNISSILLVGESGDGALQISDGAQVSAVVGTIGDQMGSAGTVTVDGPGSKLTIAGNGLFSELDIGLEGSGVLYVTHGAQVTSGAALIAGQNTAVGTVIVDGAGSMFSQATDLGIGNGSLSITGGGSVSTNGTANIGLSRFSLGTVSVDGSGSTWTVSAAVNVGSSSGLGILTVRNGGLVSAGGTLSVAAQGTLKGDGTISGAVSNGGIVAPGATIGVLHITGSYGQTTAGMLEIELAGTALGTQFDRLAVSGAVSVGGTLSVALANGFIPAVGNSFDILDWGSLSGTFGSIQLPGLSAGLEWNTAQLYTAGVLRVTSVGLPGDFNNNGVVDAADYVVWRTGLGTTYTQADYDVWRAHFGQTAGGGASVPATAAVPEPATSLPMLVTAVGWQLRRRRFNLELPQS